MSVADTSLTSWGWFAVLGLFCCFWMVSLSSPVGALVFHMIGGASRVFRVFGRLLFSPEPSSRSTAFCLKQIHMLYAWCRPVGVGGLVLSCWDFLVVDSHLGKTLSVHSALMCGIDCCTWRWLVLQSEYPESCLLLLLDRTRPRNLKASLLHCSLPSSAVALVFLPRPWYLPWESLPSVPCPECGRMRQCWRLFSSS